MNIKNGEIALESIFVKRIKEKYLSDNYVRLEIMAKDIYNKSFSYLGQSEIDQFQITVKYPDKTTKIEEGNLKFEEKSKSIIFNKILYMIGETSFEVKFNNQIIECYNCTAITKYGEFDFNKSKIEYVKEIELREDRNLSISPKDMDNVIIPSKEIYSIFLTDCIINNKTKVKINSSFYEEKNLIIFSNEENITEPGNLTLILSYNDKIMEFQVKVNEKTILENTKFFIKANESIEEVNNNNNSIITLNIENEFEIIVSLRNIYGDELHKKDDSITIKEARLFGNDMDMILFDQMKNESKLNDFILMIPEKNKEDFRYLVSGDNYLMDIQLLHDNNIVDFHFRVKLTSSENDEGYGNGVYNISHFTTNPKETPFLMKAGIIFTFNLELRTQKDLLYHRELDINQHLNYSLTSED